MTQKTTVQHTIAPVWNSQSRVLILGTMPSPASRGAGFFYMHPQNRFWRALPAVFGERLEYNNAGKRGADDQTANLAAAIDERKNFLLRRKIALWDVLLKCEIRGAADASIQNAVPNDFTQIFEQSQIRRVYCAGKSAFNLWQKHCATAYEKRFNLECACLPSASPANAAWSLERLIEAYSVLRQGASPKRPL